MWSGLRFERWMEGKFLLNTSIPAVHCANTANTAHADYSRAPKPNKSNTAIIHKIRSPCQMVMNCVMLSLWARASL